MFNKKKSYSNNLLFRKLFPFSNVKKEFLLPLSKHEIYFCDIIAKIAKNCKFRKYLNRKMKICVSLKPIFIFYLSAEHG